MKKRHLRLFKKDGKILVKINGLLVPIEHVERLEKKIGRVKAPFLDDVNV